MSKEIFGATLLAQEYEWKHNTEFISKILNANRYFVITIEKEEFIIKPISKLTHKSKFNEFSIRYIFDSKEKAEKYLEIVKTINKAEELIMKFYRITHNLREANVDNLPSQISSLISFVTPNEKFLYNIIDIRKGNGTKWSISYNQGLFKD